MAERGSRPVVGVTIGDPGGVGSELVVAAHPDLQEDVRLIAIGDAAVLRRAASELESDLGIRPVESVAEALFEPGTLDVLDVGALDVPAAAIQYGVVREDYGAATFAYVERAVELAVEGAVDALTLGPKHSQATALADTPYRDQAGLIADRTGTGPDQYTSLLVVGDLRVSHVSMHVPLREAIDLVTPNRVLQTIRLTSEGLCGLLEGTPRVAVAGLNPHAGDGGELGNEDEELIAPAVEAARDAGIDVVGPESPDTVFARAAGGAFDGVVAMYHDQGHIPIKVLGFEDALSQTSLFVGFPIVVTVVPHGPAFDIAGEGIASERSLVNSVRLAAAAV